MLIKEVLERRDELRSYLHSLSVAKNYCKLIGDDTIIDNLEKLYLEVENEYQKIDDSLKPFENMSM